MSKEEILKEKIRKKDALIKQLRVKLKRKSSQVDKLKQRLKDIKNHNLMDADEHKICESLYDSIPGEYVFRLKLQSKIIIF